MIFLTHGPFGENRIVRFDNHIGDFISWLDSFLFNLRIWAKTSPLFSMYSVDSFMRNLEALDIFFLLLVDFLSIIKKPKKNNIRLLGLILVKEKSHFQLNPSLYLFQKVGLSLDWLVLVSFCFFNLLNSGVL